MQTDILPRHLACKYSVVAPNLIGADTNVIIPFINLFSVIPFKFAYLWFHCANSFFESLPHFSISYGKFSPPNQDNNLSYRSMQSCRSNSDPNHDGIPPRWNMIKNLMEKLCRMIIDKPILMSLEEVGAHDCSLQHCQQGSETICR